MASILLADDQPREIRVAAEYLVSQGHTVWVAAGGSEAIALVYNGHPDVAVVDLMMPRTDGLQVLDAIRARYPASETRVVVITLIGATGEPMRNWDPEQMAVHGFVLAPYRSWDIILAVEQQLYRKVEWGFERPLP